MNKLNLPKPPGHIFSIEKEEICLIQKFFDDQKKLPEQLRSNICTISCHCKRCKYDSFL